MIKKRERLLYEECLEYLRNIEILYEYKGGYSPVLRNSDRKREISSCASSN